MYFESYEKLTENTDPNLLREYRTRLYESLVCNLRVKAIGRYYCPQYQEFTNS